MSNGGVIATEGGRGSPHAGSATDDLEVLLVEDDDQDVLLLERQIADDDLPGSIRLTRARSLADAAELVTGGRFDVALLDLGLPDASGLDCFTRFTGLAPDLPVVVLSGRTDRELAVTAVREGAQDFLVKGRLGGTEIGRVLRHAIERSRARRREQTRTLRQSLLLDLGTLALEEDRPGPILREAARTLAEGLGMPRAEIWERDGGELRLRAAHSTDGAPDVDARLEPAPGGLHHHALRQPGPVVIPDLSAEPDLHLHHPAAQHRAALAASVPTGPDLWGLVVALAGEPREPDDDAIGFVRQVAGTIGTTMRRLRVEADRTERIKELTALREVAHAVQQDLTGAQLVRRVADRLRMSFQFPAATVVSVTIDEHEACRPDPADEAVAASLTAPVIVDGVTRGRVRVGYTDDLPFLEEEQDLLDTVAEALSTWLARSEAVTALTASQRRLRLLLDQLPAVIYTLDDDLTITSVAGRPSRELSAETGDVVGRPFREAIADLATDGRDGTIDAHRAALDGRSSRFRLEVFGRWWEGLAEPLEDAPDGSAVLGLVVDYTERRHRRRALTDSRVRLRALFDNALDAILLADDDGRYIDANPAATDLLGYSHDELLDMRITDLTQAGDAPERWQRLHDDGSQSGRITLRHRDGHAIVAEYQAVADIQPGLHLSVLRDVTARVRTEQALRASEEHFRRLADNASEGIVLLELPEWSLEYANPAIEAITGFTGDELAEDPLLLGGRVHEQDRNGLDRRLAAPDAAAEPLRLRYRHADGDWIWLEIHVSGVRDSAGELTAVQGMVVDVTEQQRRRQAIEAALRREREAGERLRRVDALKDGFLRAVSHELRTPLASVYGFATTLRDHDERLPEEQRRQVIDRLVTNAEELRELLEDLLDVNRLAGDSIDLDPEPVDLAALAGSVADRMPLPDHELRRDLTEVFVRAEPIKLERVVANLLGNAARHTPAGTTVWLRTEPAGQGGLLIVEDDGPGVPDGLAEEIFEPFGQGPQSREDANPGTGIGLNLVAQLAELHGGRAWVEERPGGGASFRVLVPGDAGAPGDV